jgi:hypothetical protein
MIIVETEKEIEEFLNYCSLNKFDAFLTCFKSDKTTSSKSRKNKRKKDEEPVINLRKKKTVSIKKKKVKISDSPLQKLSNENMCNNSLQI